MKEDNQNRKGIFFALLAALVSGVSIFYNKQVISAGIDPLIFNIIKNGGVAIILSLVLLLRSAPKPLRSPLAMSKETPYLNLILIGLIGGSIPFILFFEGLAHIPAINANIIQKSLFVWVALLAIPILKEKINPIQIIGYLLVVYANFFIGGLTSLTFGIYEGFVLAATLFWAVENIIAKKILSTTDSSIVAWGRMFFGSIFLLIIAVFTGKTNFFSNVILGQLLPLSGSILLLTLYVTFWYKALKLAPATQVSAILIFATPITNILTSVFINRNLNSILNINTYILIIGVSLIGLNLPKILNHVKLLPKKAK